MDTLRDHIDQLQVDCDRFLEEKSTDTARVTQLEAKLDAVQSRVYELEGELTDLRQKYWSEQEEWKQFQSDLQMAVVIANEIKVRSPWSWDDLPKCGQFPLQKMPFHWDVMWCICDIFYYSIGFVYLLF